MHKIIQKKNKKKKKKANIRDDIEDISIDHTRKSPGTD